MRSNIFPIFLIFPLLMTFQFGCSRKTYQPESATPAACAIRAEVDENGNFKHMSPQGGRKVQAPTSDYLQRTGLAFCKACRNLGHDS